MVGDFGYGTWMLDLVDKYDCGFLVVTFGCGVQQGFGRSIWFLDLVLVFRCSIRFYLQYFIAVFGCIVSLQFLVWLYCFIVVFRCGLFWLWSSVVVFGWSFWL